MKRFLLVFFVLLGLVFIAVPDSYAAVQVNFDTFSLNSWGRLYGNGVNNQDSFPGVEPIGVPLMGLDPVNPGHSFDNPFLPATNNPTQAFTPNVWSPPDGTEDSWGILGLNRVTDVVGNTLMEPEPGKEWAIFFWAADDVLVASEFAPAANPILGSGIYSRGVIAEIWETNALDGTTYAGTSVGLGTGGRLEPTDPSFFSTVTDELGGRRLLTLVGHPRFLDLDVSGAFEEASDDTNGDGLPDVYDQVAIAVGPPFVPPFTFGNNILFDVVTGLGDAWEALFDSNDIPVPNSLSTGLADLAFSGQFFDNRKPGSGGPGNGNNPPDPDDMWTVYNQPSVQGFMKPMEPELACRVTGGGVDSSGQWDGTMAYGRSKKEQAGVNRYTFGGQAGAPTGSQPQPGGEWTHHQQNGPDGSFIFHAGTASAPEGTEIDMIVCSDPGFCDPARRAPAKQIDFEGAGTFKNIKNPSPSLSGVLPGETFHWFEVHIEDLGEPGKSGKQDPPAEDCPVEGSADMVADCDCPDFYRIKIFAGFDPETENPNKTESIYEVFGYITGGNLQIHPPIQ